MKGSLGVHDVRLYFPLCHILWLLLSSTALLSASGWRHAEESPKNPTKWQHLHPVVEILIGKGCRKHLAHRHIGGHDGENRHNNDKLVDAWHAGHLVGAVSNGDLEELLRLL